MSTEDKENQSLEPHESTVKTPLKQTATSSSFLAEIQPAAACHLTTPPKPDEISPRDPWTPTANLKMLISAASPEIRNREQGEKISDGRIETFEDHLSGDEYEKSQPSRKEKSLGLLCQKFLARYPSYPDPSKNNEICLDEVAEELNVERRRIYDIMNVLESLHMVSRLAKNRYTWHGCHNRERILQILKKVAEKNKYMQQIQLLKNGECEEDPEGTDQKMERDIPSNHMDMSFIELPGMEFRGASVNSRKDKSLRVLSQKFVMLFLVSTPEVVSLEVAAKILIGEDHVENLDKSKFKTKIRRLYDIANVLSSLDLIKKVHVKEEKGRKPAFKWTGPDVFSEVQNTPSVLTPTTVAPAPVPQKSSRESCSKALFPTRFKQGFTRHPSLIKSEKSIHSDRRKIHSAPSSPVKKNMSQIPSSFPSKMAQLAAICKQQLDEQSREFKRTKLKMASSPLPHTLALPPESCLKRETFILPSHGQLLPLIHSSAFPPVLPHVHSNVSYALYVHPSQTPIATAYNPSFTGQPVPCADVFGRKSPAETRSKAAPSKIHTENNDINLEESIRVAKKQEGSKDNGTPEKGLKRCTVVLEDSPVKKGRSEAVKSRDMLPAWSSSSYLVPLMQCNQFGNETTVSSKGKAEMCLAEEKSCSSCTAGGIPVTSEFTAINFPAFHITPLNLMLPPSSVTSIPLVNSTVLPSVARANPNQAPGSSALNFTLQHLGLIPATLQMSANPGTESALSHQGEECVSTVSKSVDLKQGKALQNALLEHGQELNGKPVLTIPLPQTAIPVTCRVSQECKENIFCTSSKPSAVPSSCSSAAESNVDGISQ